MSRVLTGLLVSALLLPLAASAYVDCRETTNGCTAVQLMDISNQTHLTLQDRISALQQAITALTQQLSLLQRSATAGTGVSAGCLDLNNSLVIGSTDAKTNGEVTKLQGFLVNEGYFGNPADQTGLSSQPTGYYGMKTADAVMRWQKAHGMDFVTISSGVGPMTRTKMKCTGGASAGVTGVAWHIEKANPAITGPDDYRQYEQAIAIDITRSDNTTKRHVLGTAYGCSGTSAIESPKDGKTVFGRVKCYFALSGVDFVAYTQGSKFIVERHNDDASGLTSGTLTKVLEI